MVFFLSKVIYSDSQFRGIDFTLPRERIIALPWQRWDGSHLVRKEMNLALPVAFKINSATSRYFPIFLASLEMMYGVVE
jgi:hypothetical protein